MNLKKAKRLRLLAKCSTADRPQGLLYGRRPDTGAIEHIPFSVRGYYRHLKRIFN